MWSLLRIRNAFTVVGYWTCNSLHIWLGVGMATRSHLCDPDGSLSNSLESSQVLSALNAVDAGPWYPYCGPFQMGIAVVGRVDGATSEFAPAVLDRWGVGSKGCNTGIVLGIAIEDRSMYLATGGGAKEYVSDAEAQAIIDRMKPLLRDNRVADALEQCVSDVLRVLNREENAVREPIEAGPFFFSFNRSSFGFPVFRAEFMTGGGWWCM